VYLLLFVSWLLYLLLVLYGPCRRNGRRSALQGHLFSYWSVRVLYSAYSVCISPTIYGKKRSQIYAHLQLSVDFFLVFGIGVSVRYFLGRIWWTTWNITCYTTRTHFEFFPSIFLLTGRTFTYRCNYISLNVSHHLNQ
jgi:hypothetical protein